MRAGLLRIPADGLQTLHEPLGPPVHHRPGMTDRGVDIRNEDRDSDPNTSHIRPRCGNDPIPSRLRQRLYEMKNSTTQNLIRSKRHHE